jgi:hypothetical protein
MKTLLKIFCYILALAFSMFVIFIPGIIIKYSEEIYALFYLAVTHLGMLILFVLMPIFEAIDKKFK